MTATKKSGLVFLGIFLIGMLFIPPSMQPMIPEAAAKAVQDNGDFYLHYEPSTKYADLESWIKDTEYFEIQIEWLNETFKTPWNVQILVIECASFMPSDRSVNAFYASKAITGTGESAIVYCYELIEHQFEVLAELM